MQRKKYLKNIYTVVDPLGVVHVLLLPLVLLFDFRDLFQRFLHQSPEPEDDICSDNMHRAVPERGNGGLRHGEL